MEKVFNESGESGVMPYNQWVKGIAAKEFNSARVYLKDILDKRGGNTQYPNDSKADNVLPYPLPHLVSVLGNSLADLANSENMLKDVTNNPLLQDSHNKELIKKAAEFINKAAEEVKKAGAALDYLKFSVK